MSHIKCALVLLLGVGSSGAQTLTSNLRFTPIPPCRVLDTRGNGFAGQFGPPSLTGGGTRTFPLTSSSCGLPASAKAYALNATLVPISDGPVYSVTLWPTGQPRPTVNTVVEPRGRIVATDAIIAAGASGSIDIYSSNPTDILVDVNGYFTDGAGLEFYPMTPCRIVETRSSEAPPDIGVMFGPPAMASGTTRSFPFPQGRCNIPASAQAYYVNFTVVPSSGFFGYLTTWPSGQGQPLVSTLNSLDGRILANGAIVPAGANAGINVFVTDPTNLIIDVAGYFAPANGSGRLFNTVYPCRAATLSMPTGGDQSTPVAGTCGVPGTAAGIAMNMTAAMNQPVGYFSIWPAGQAWPGVSVMNAGDAVPGSAVGNGPIVSTGSSGQVSVRSTGPATVTLDLTGYFAAAQGPPPPTCRLVSDPTPSLLTAVRTGGNTVLGQGALHLTEPAIGTWLVYLRAHLHFRPSGSGTWTEINYGERSTLISNGAAINTTYYSPNVEAPLEQRGNGDYRVTLSQHGVCGGVDWQLSPGNNAISNPVSVTRPTITTNGILGAWWFGAIGKDDASNGYFSSAPIYGTPNWNGTLTYSITQGADKIQLTCTNCNNTVAQAKAASASCALDITVTASAQGFLAAAPVRLIVNRPAGRYPQPTYYNGASANHGYWSKDHFTFTDLCALSMSSVAHHERFPGTFTSYWPGGAGAYWTTAPQADGWTQYTVDQWVTHDDIVVGCDDPNCNPTTVSPPAFTFLRSNISAMDPARVARIVQMWYVGDATGGSSNGFLANQCSQTLYRDHAEDINDIQ